MTRSLSSLLCLQRTQRLLGVWRPCSSFLLVGSLCVELPSPFSLGERNVSGKLPLSDGNTQLDTLLTSFQKASLNTWRLPLDLNTITHINVDANRLHCEALIMAQTQAGQGLPCWTGRNKMKRKQSKLPFWTCDSKTDVEQF